MLKLLPHCSFSCLFKWNCFVISLSDCCLLVLSIARRLYVLGHYCISASADHSVWTLPCCCTGPVHTGMLGPSRCILLLFNPDVLYLSFFPCLTARVFKPALQRWKEACSLACSWSSDTPVCCSPVGRLKHWFSSLPLLLCFSQLPFLY